MKSQLLGQQAARFNELYQTHIATAPEDSLNDLTCMAAHICGTPIALVSFIENNQMCSKAQVGLDVTEIASVLELCSVATPKDELIVVPDIRIDERFSNSSVVTSHPYIRFYTGLPLITPQGQILGILCVIDYIPRELSQKQMKMLLALTRQVINQLEQQQSLYNLTNIIYEDKQTQQKLQQSQTRLRLLNSISTKITAGMSVAQVIEHTIKQISEHFKSLRIVYSTIDEKNITVLHSLQPSGMPPLDKIIPLPDLPGFVNPLRNYQPLVTNNVAKAPWLEPLNEVFLSFGIAAMLNVPLHHSDKLVGLICCDSPEPRQWSEHEIATISEIAEYLSFALKEAHAQQQRSQAEAALRQQHQRERLLSKITQQIRSSLNLGEILHTTVTEVRHFFQAERVVIYHCEPDGDCVTIAQSAESDWLSPLDKQLSNSWLDQQTKFARQGNTYVINDIEQIELRVELRKFLEQQQVQAGLIIPIMEKNQLLGMLAIYQCSQPRFWQLEEMELLEQLATQVAIAIQQGKLYQQVQQLNRELEHKVQKRTTQLQQAVDLEATLKRITDKVRDSLDETQILQTAVEQLALALGIDCCRALVYPFEQDSSAICYEHISSVATFPQIVEPIAEFPEIYQQLLQQQYFQCCFLTSSKVQLQETILVCSIIDEQGVLGELRLIASPNHYFQELEIRLVRQVANQCAIALRQARLYQAAQKQTEELERLNHLKDDFLSTVSHELRSPMTNIKMALKMLAMSFKPLDLGDAEEKIQRYLGILGDESKRELVLINNLLDLSRLEAGSESLELSTINLKSWLPKIIEPFVARAHNQQQCLEVELPTQLPLLKSDKHVLERILSELLNNACKYTPAGEKITVSARVTQTKMQLQVSNSGVEIAAEEISHIFEKFYRIPHHDPWKHGGTGLGLALVKKLVEHLGGTIKAESLTAQTSFSVQLLLT